MVSGGCEKDKVQIGLNQCQRPGIKARAQEQGRGRTERPGSKAKSWELGREGAREPKAQGGAEMDVTRESRVRVGLRG